MLKWKTLVAAAITTAIAGCGGEDSPSSSTSPTPSLTEAQYEEFVEESFTSSETISSFTTQPAEVDESIDSATIEGVDSDGNGLRDKNERIVYQALMFATGVDSEAYTELLNLVSYMSPKPQPVANSIDQAKIYCDYTALPDGIKLELSLDILYSMVLDTTERISAFNASAIEQTSSLGEEVCQ